MTERISQLDNPTLRTITESGGNDGKLALNELSGRAFGGNSGLVYKQY